MKSKKFTKSMLVIAVPIMIQSLITASVNLIDTVMIGKLGGKIYCVAGHYKPVFYAIQYIGHWPLYRCGRSYIAVLGQE